MERDDIFLYGAPASGKTTLGAALAASLGVEFVDLDAAIAAAAGRGIPAIFAAEGEAGFRRRESEALAAVVASHGGSRRVVALGGGALLSDSNRALCESSGTVLCLDTPPGEELARRLADKPSSRPLGDKARERAPHYASFPNRVARWFELDSSLVVVGRGIAKCVLQGARFVADATVAQIYAKSVPAPVATIPSGEKFKTPATVMALWSAFAKSGVGRRDRVVALGGGVTGDLVGFAAATWMRGIDWMNVPTTLLSMVDASVGGKTGCDLPEGKNLAGAFHSPRLVAVDAAFLETLSAPLLACGKAEMVKHEVIGGLRGGVGGGIPTAAEIAESLSVKVSIVREDPFERSGRRMLLNCGHTIGHAVEKFSDYALSHGEAVAIGCVEEARLAVRMGLAPEAWLEERAERFAAAGLPVALPAGIALDALVPLMRGDKKREGGSVAFALPCGMGDVRAVKVDLSSGRLP